MVPPPESRLFYSVLKAVAVTIIFIALTFRKNDHVGVVPFSDKALTPSDLQFYERFKNLSFPFEQWNHLSHVRLTFITCAQTLTVMEQRSASQATPTKIITNIFSSAGAADTGLSVTELYNTVYTRVKALILSYNEKHESKLTTGYHETITHLWLHLIVHAFIELLGSENQSAVRFNDLIKLHPELTRFETSFDYYSKSSLYSDAAKHNFIKPELKPFPMSFISDVKQ